MLRLNKLVAYYCELKLEFWQLKPQMRKTKVRHDDLSGFRVPGSSVIRNSKSKFIFAKLRRRVQRSSRFYIRDIFNHCSKLSWRPIDLNIQKRLKATSKQELESDGNSGKVLDLRAKLRFLSLPAELVKRHHVAEVHQDELSQGLLVDLNLEKSWVKRLLLLRNFTKALPRFFK